jgi:hypothetical protein
MSLRYPGGLITKSPTAPTSSAAKGIWTLEQALQYIKAGTWPLSLLGDPYFQYNTLLLPGQGTNNTQNNSFLDSSGNGYNPSRSGETTQGTFTPFSGANGNWSNYFDGNGDFLTCPNNAAFDFASGDVTLEAWVYLNAISSQTVVAAFATGGTGFTAWSFSINSSGYLLMDTWVGGTEQFITATSNPVAANQWTHIAYTRASGTSRLFVNGASCSFSGSISQGINSGGNLTSIASSRYSGFEGYLNGYISNCRVVKGTAVYTSAFTPPTAPLTAISGTSLLTCQSNRFVDNSTNAFTLTSNGNAAVTPFQPFGAPTSAYSAATNGGSGYFDGSGDYLDAGAQTAFAFGTGSWTVEAWVYVNSLASEILLFDTRSGASTAGVGCRIATDGTLSYSGSANNALTTSAIKVNEWNHIAWSYDGTTLSGYINGSRGGTATPSFNISQNNGVVGRVGFSAAGYMNGYIGGLRVVKGTAVYSGTSFTVPTAPLTAITNTSLLLNYTNAGIIDNAQDNDLITVADAKISTTQFKWGTSSIFFDGTGDYLDARLNPPQILNADFTVEMWVYPTTITGSNRTFLFLENGSNSAAFFMYGATGYLGLDINNVATYNLGSAAITTGSWQHIAFIRIGTAVKAYINGNQVGTATVSAALGSSGVMRIGAGASAGSPYFGYIADMRVTKGYARYPYNFTAPTAAFPLYYQAAPTPTSDPYFDYTTLLLPGNQPSGVTDTSNNVFKDSSANNFTITRNPASGPNAPTQGTFTPFSQTGWGNYFDGTSDYLTLASSADFNIFGGDMTFECWFYSTAASLGSRSEHLFAFVQDATNRESLYFNGTTLTFWTSSGAGNGPRITYANTPQNQWIHVAVAKSGSTFTMYINGVSVGTSTTTQYSTSNQSLQIGTYNSAAAGPDSFTGYISNVRVVKGTPVYTTNFIPSTTPLTAVTNTVLLTCQSNRFIDTNTQTTAKTVTPSGDTSVQAFSPFNPTASYSAATVGGSGYFDGTGDFLSLTNNAAFNFGSAAFTIEFWYYPTTLSGTQCLITNYGGSTTGFVIQMGGSTPGSGRIDAGFSGDGADITSTNAVRLNSWNHIAISGTPGATGIKLFINGAQEGSTYTGATSLDTSSTLLIGEVASTNRLSGYLCGLRLVKGGALYTATFTPPTSPPTTTVSSGTVSLLTNFTNGAIIDSTAKNDLETVGNAVISTAQSKFGGSSMFFDGTGDYLKGNAFTAGLTGSGDFTIEGWIYISSLPGAEVSICSTTETGGTGIIFGLGGGGNVNKLQLAIGNLSVANPTVVDSATFTTGAWVHFAAVRYSGTIYLFKNGVSVGTPTSASGTLDRQTVTVGAWPSGSATLTGYINDLRITKGIARYTQNFTPPTTAYLTL